MSETVIQTLPWIMLTIDVLVWLRLRRRRT